MFKNYMKKFIKEEDGVETIEFLALIAVAAALVAIIAGIGAKMKSTADAASSKMDDALNQIGGI